MLLKDNFSLKIRRYAWVGKAITSRLSDRPIKLISGETLRPRGHLLKSKVLEGMSLT